MRRKEKFFYLPVLTKNSFQYHYTIVAVANCMRRGSVMQMTCSKVYKKDETGGLKSERRAKNSMVQWTDDITLDNRFFYGTSYG